MMRPGSVIVDVAIDQGVAPNLAAHHERRSDFGLGRRLHYCVAKCRAVCRRHRRKRSTLHPAVLSRLPKGLGETRVATTGYLRDGLNIGTERSHGTVVMRWDTRISAEEALPEISLHCSSTNRDKRVPNGCLGLIRIVLGCKVSALAGEQDLRYGFMSICDAPARLVLVMRVWIGWGRIASPASPDAAGARVRDLVKNFGGCARSTTARSVCGGDDHGGGGGPDRPNGAGKTTLSTGLPVFFALTQAACWPMGWISPAFRHTAFSGADLSPFLIPREHGTMTFWKPHAGRYRPGRRAF